MQFLIERGSSTAASFGGASTLLAYAIERCDFKMVSRLVDAGVDVRHTVDGHDPYVFRAALSGDAQILALLLYHGANPNALSILGASPLHAAILMNDPDKVAILMQHGADSHIVDAQDMSAIDKAKASGRSQIVDIIVGWAAEQ